jgi:cellobionic acid phosphorylase
LYQVNQADKAYQVLKQMLPSDDPQDQLQRGQLPVFIPNYYRGAYQTLPRTAGRSSQLFNTGTVHWVYRCLVEGLFGVKGDQQGLTIAPQLPASWNKASVLRRFRGADFHIRFERVAAVKAPTLWLDDVEQKELAVRTIKAGQSYKLLVQLPIITSEETL